MNKKEVKKGLLPYLVLFIVMLGILYFFNLSNTKVNQFTYDQFITHMDNKEITEIAITPRSSAGVYEIRGK